MEVRADFIIHFNEKAGRYLIIPTNLVDEYFNSNFEMDSPFFGEAKFSDVDKYFEDLLK